MPTLFAPTEEGLDLLEVLKRRAQKQRPQLTEAQIVEAMSNQSESEIARILRQVHPVYESMSSDWLKFYECFVGQVRTSTYLHQYVRENSDAFAQRLHRAYFPNYCRKIVNAYRSYIFEHPTRIDRNYTKVKDLPKNFTDNVDRRGTGLHEFMSEAYSLAKVFGHVGILVDMPHLSPDTPVFSLQDEQQLGIRPYFSVIGAPNIVDWGHDKDGNLEWVRLRDDPKMLADVMTRPFDLRPKMVDQYRTFTKNWWFVHRIVDTEVPRIDYPSDDKKKDNEHEKAELVAVGQHSLGAVPFVMLRPDKHPRYNLAGISALQEIADLNLAIYNWLSLLDEEIYACCIALLAMPRRDDPKAPILAGHGNVIEYDGPTPPQYITAPTSPMKMIIEQVDKTLMNIYRLASMQNSLEQIPGQKTGVAFAYTFTELNQALSDDATRCQETELRAMQIAAAYQMAPATRNEQFMGECNYPSEFGVEDFLHKLEEIESVKESIPSPTLVKQLAKSVARKMLARIPGSLAKDIEKEIDDADLEAVVMSNTESVRLEEAAQNNAEVEGQAMATAPQPSPGGNGSVKKQPAMQGRGLRSSHKKE